MQKGHRRIRRADDEVAPKKVKPVDEHAILKKSRKVANAPKPLHMQKQSETFMSRRPVDDVWFMKLYPTPYFTLQEAIDMHRKANRGSMFNNESGIIMMNALVSLKTKKKTKFAKVYQGMNLLPHLFKTNFPKPRVIVFSEDPAEVDDAIERGAKLAGGSTLIQQIAGGEVDLSDEDLEKSISTSALLPELIPLRAKLPNFPNLTQGTTGHPMSEMLDQHLDGYQYRTVPHESYEPSVAWLKFPIGLLDMELSHLEENWKCWQDVMQNHYALKEDVLFQAQCTVPPSSEVFEIRLAGQDAWGQRNVTPGVTTQIDSTDTIKGEEDDSDLEDVEEAES